MRAPIVTGLLWLSAIGAALICGVFFAFSTFIMTALDRAGQAHGMAAMNWINTTILRSLFMPLFLGSTLTSAALVVLAIIHWNDGAGIAGICLAGGLLYVLGTFVSTMVFNVPLNNALAVADPASAASADIWRRYLKEWTFWNHVRTLASLIAAILFTYALINRT